MSVRRIDADPEWAAGLPGAQYAFAVEIDSDTARTPEQWARAVFEQAPPRWWRLLLGLGWRFLLGLRLGPRQSSAFVAGWAIVASGETSITLAAASRWLSAQDLFLVTPGGAIWVTVVRYDKPLGRLLWASAAPVHQLSAPWLFTNASQ